MTTFAIIVLILFMMRSALEIGSSYSESRLQEALEKELEVLKTQKKWEFWTLRAIDWTLDLLVIICLIAACF